MGTTRSVVLPSADVKHEAVADSDSGPTPFAARVRRPRAQLNIKSVTFDCADGLRLATFWATALGSNVDEDATPEKAFVEAPGWSGPNMWFNAVPEPKTAKNRIHLDLRAPGPIADEVRRLVGLGATVRHDGPGLVVLQDPEGNEFCVE